MISNDSPSRVDLCLASLRFHPAYSGPAVRFKRYEPGLRERGIDMRVFAADWTDPEPQGGGPSAENQVIDGIPVRRVSVRQGLSPARLFRTYERALIEDLRERGLPDLVQLLDLRLGSIATLRELRRLGVPSLYINTMMRDPGVGRLKNTAWRLPFRFLDCIVVSTVAMRDSLKAARIGTRIDVIPNGVDTDRFRPVQSTLERKELKRALGLDPESKVVVFVGGYLNARKGVDLLASAWAAIAAREPEAHLVLVGPTLNALRPAAGQEAFLSAVADDLDRSGARDRVHLTGPVSNVEDYLRAAEVFAFPSRREGMPNVVLEAFASGTAAVLCPFVGMSPEFGVPGVHYAAAEHRSEDLSARILELLGEPERRAAMGARARGWVLESLGVERSLNAYASLYRELATKG